MMERVWRIVADHPCVTSKSVAQIMGEEHSEVSSHLSAMVKRGMIRSEMIPIKVRCGNGFTDRRVHHYTACIKQYELLPLKKKSARNPKPLSVTPLQQIKDSIPRAELTPLTRVTPGFDIEQLTLSEARALYQKLHVLFGK